MSYLLFLGFKSIVYKVPPKIRVYLDDIFLDEFSIIPTKLCDINNLQLHSDDWLSRRNLLSNSTTNLQKIHTDYNKLFDNDIVFKILEIDSEIFKKNLKSELRIELVNASNNYTNGFMTKSTLISLYVVRIIPKNVIVDAEHYCDAFYTSRRNEKSLHSDTKSILNFYKSKTIAFDILANNTIFKKNNNKIFAMTPWYSNNNVEYIRRYSWLGQKGFFKFLVLNKWIQIKNKDFKNVNFFEVELLCLRNKYKDYEN